MWVFDATPLIYLAKIGRLELVAHFEASCVVPERVFAEVVTAGIEAGYPDARRIERSVDADRFETVSVTLEDPLSSRLREHSTLSDADVAVLACANAHDGVAVMDETYGRDVAATEGITTRGTAYLVLTLAKQGAIGVDDARTAIDSMIDEGWYCAPDVYARILRTLDALAEDERSTY